MVIFNYYYTIIPVLVIYHIYKSMEFNMNVLEYLCLDNENKFRSKIIITDNDIENVESLLTDSSLIDNVIESSYDIVLLPIKIIKNPFIRKENHWIVFCEYKHPTGVAHKNNTRYPLQTLAEKNPSIELATRQEFVLFKDNKPLGWRDSLDIFKNYSGKIEYSQSCEEVVHKILDAALYVGLPVNSIEMTRIVGKWCVSMNTGDVLESCDDLILFRYIAQKICFQNNILFSLHSNPIDNSNIFSRCEFSISTANMRDEETGIQHIVKACEKLKLKHLEQHKSLSPHNSKKFTYSQSNNEKCVQVILGKGESGVIKDNRCASDNDPYSSLNTLLTTITSEYNINTMSNDLETLKHRFNYHNVIDFEIDRPTIAVSRNVNCNESDNVKEIKKANRVEKKKEEKPTGLSGLAKILRLNDDSDDECETSNNNENDDEEEVTEKNRVEHIIKTLKSMNISHNVLQSSSAPKAVAQEKEEISTNAIEPHSFMTQGQVPTLSPQMALPPMMPQANVSTATSSLYTLPSQL